MNMLKYILTLLLIITVLFSVGQEIRLTGKIFNKEENMPFPFVNVMLSETNLGATTDTNGNFTIERIPIGIYNLRVQYITYGDTTIKDLRLINDTSIIVQFESPPCEYDKHKDDRTCPICGKQDRVVPIVYGLVVGPMDTKNFYYAGCLVTDCDPNWYCKRDKYKF